MPRMDAVSLMLFTKHVTSEKARLGQLSLP
jgi:hypothetical protein